VTKRAERVSAPGRLLYSVEEAADLLGIGRTYMFHLVATGEIDSFKIGKRRKIPRDALDGYIERLRSEQAAVADGLAALRLPRQRDGRQD
jgi:excisionase family DNA binding protein